MSKCILRVFYGLLVLLVTSSCEKDDLCPASTPGTPRLIIVFKDRANPALDKVVTKIQLRAVGETTFAPLNDDNALVLNATDSIAVPLRFAASGTSYELIRTDENDIENTDIITFSYTTSEEYINRACGFKVLYNNLTATLTPEPAIARWIQSVRLVQDNVTSNASAHVEIRH